MSKNAGLNRRSFMKNAGLRPWPAQPAPWPLVLHRQTLRAVALPSPIPDTRTATMTLVPFTIAPDTIAPAGILHLVTTPVGNSSSGWVSLLWTSNVHPVSPKP